MNNNTSLERLAPYVVATVCAVVFVALVATFVYAKLAPVIDALNQ